MYSTLSVEAHADPRGFVRMIDPDDRAVALDPQRTDATRASLLFHARLALHHARTVAIVAGFELDDYSELDADIKAGWTRMEAQHTQQDDTV